MTEEEDRVYQVLWEHLTGERAGGKCVPGGGTSICEDPEAQESRRSSKRSTMAPTVE